MVKQLADKQPFQKLDCQSRAEINAPELLMQGCGKKIDTQGLTKTRKEISANKNSIAANVLQNVVDRAIPGAWSLGLTDDTHFCLSKLQTRTPLPELYGADEVHQKQFGQTDLKEYRT